MCHIMLFLSELAVWMGCMSYGSSFSANGDMSLGMSQDVDTLLLQHALQGSDILK